MKKILALILALVVVLSVAACGCNGDIDATEPTQNETEISTEEIIAEDEGEEEKEEVPADKEEAPAQKEEATEKVEENLTLGNTLLAFFKEEANKGTSAEEIANKISTLPVIEFACMTSPVEPGYLAGFDEEITNFKSAVAFAPMIGSIPFVGYIFEAEDADALIATLKDNANLRWNICVEAEEMVTGKVGNKVFFVMCPKSLAE